MRISVQLYNPNWDSLRLVLPHCWFNTCPLLASQRTGGTKKKTLEAFPRTLTRNEFGLKKLKQTPCPPQWKCLFIQDHDLGDNRWDSRVQLITPFILAGWADFIKIYKLVWPHASSINRGFEYCLFGAILKRKLVKFHTKQLSPHRFHCAATYRRKIADSHHVQVQLPPTKSKRKSELLWCVEDVIRDDPSVEIERITIRPWFMYYTAKLPSKNTNEVCVLVPKVTHSMRLIVESSGNCETLHKFLGPTCA